MLIEYRHIQDICIPYVATVKASLFMGCRSYFIYGISNDIFCTKFEFQSANCGLVKTSLQLQIAMEELCALKVISPAQLQNAQSLIKECLITQCIITECIKKECIIREYIITECITAEYIGTAFDQNNPLFKRNHGYQFRGLLEIHSL